MTIGQRIAKLRTAEGISQEQLAEKLSVSRQSVSKWKIDQAFPQIDKILLMCELFGVTTDELLKGGVKSEAQSKAAGNKYHQAQVVLNELLLGLLIPLLQFDQRIGLFLSFERWRKNISPTDVVASILLYKSDFH